jgi:fructokinase
MIGQHEKGLAENHKFQKTAGGAPANVAVAASRLGADSHMTATVGDDYFGDFLVNRLRKERVNVSNVQRSTENKTTLAFVALNGDAEPEFSFNRGADKIIEEDQIEHHHDIIHIGSLPLTHPETAANIIRTVQRTDAKVSFDPNLREGLLNERYLNRLKQIVEHTDILFAAEDELGQLGGKEHVLDKVDEVVASKGAEGVEVLTEGNTYTEKPPEVDVKDTTGAGDALAGAYLAHRHEGVETATRKAVHAGSLSTTETGAMEALPDKQELENALKS